MSPIVNLVYTQEKCEGFFRFQHMRVRSDAESIAFLNGGQFEYQQSDKLLDDLISVQKKIIFRKFILNISVYLFDYIGSIVAFIVLAVPLFSGALDHLSPSDLSELISQNTFIQMYLIQVFTTIVDTSTNFTIIAGTTHRIGQLIEELLNKKRAFTDSEMIAYKPSNNPNSTSSQPQSYCKLINVSINLPQNGKRLLEKLNLHAIHGTNLLISGPSGTCKTSILRVLKGLWTETNGFIERYLSFNDPNSVMILPQKAFLTSGSLLNVKLIN